MGKWVKWDNQQVPDIDWDAEKIPVGSSPLYSHSEISQNQETSSLKPSGGSSTVTAASILSWIIGVIQIILGVLNLVSSLSASAMRADSSEALSDISKELPVYGISFLFIGGFFIVVGIFIWKNKQDY
jgi:hypothetical protein